ncbi:MAG TPA: methyltransferase domain-containing protein [Steroidobacteraceae bacterium]|jgi:arsenite methyltransferase|nr:methyltransferase domain-containing protein [Steroidobacteraceae bacterium]
MQVEQQNGQTDVWSEWLLHRRHADDPAYHDVVKSVVQRYADQVLDAARLAPGMTMADIGAGEGILAFRAIERIGARLNVVLTDISAPMLAHAESVAAQRGVTGQCTFLKCSAESLARIADSSIDVVAARAAIAYVPDKAAAFNEFYRVLKPGGRISIAEPILQDEAFFARALRRRVDTETPQPPDQFLRLLHRWKAAQFPDTEENCAKSPHVNYSERDLLNFVRASGFADIHLQLHIDVAPSLITSWEIFLDSSPHPWAPSLRSVLADRFTAQEREFFEKMVRPTVESGKNLTTDRIAYMNATKPPA